MNRTQFLENIRHFVLDRGLISRGDRLLIAVSGGPDSMCLLLVLSRLREELDFGAEAAHFDHGTRGGESGRDAGFVDEQCRALGIPLASERWSKPEGLHFHTAARKARYDFFGRTASERGMNKVATGHQSDDQAESILMRLVRGTGRSALMGIPVSRSLETSQGEVLLIRPLATARRQEIEEYLRTEGVPWIEDPSNRDPQYLRSRIRQDLIPHLQKEYNPKVVDALLRFRDIVEIEEEFLDSQTQEAEGEVLAGADPLKVDRAAFRELHPAIRRRVLRRVLRSLFQSRIEQLGDGVRGKDIDEDVILRVEEAIISGQLGDQLSLSGPVSLHVEPHAVVFECTEEPGASLEGEWPLERKGTTSIPCLSLDVRVEEKRVENWEEVVRNCTSTRQVFDFSENRGPLAIRTCRPGDAFHPLGGPGKKKVSDLLSEKHVPSSKRRSWPILVSGEDIAWVIGLRSAERFKVQESTRVAHWIEVEDLEV